MSRYGITLGDPAGIGPEITLKALAQPGLLAAGLPVIYGSARLLRQTASRFALTLPENVEIVDVDQAGETVEIGVTGRAAGAIAFASIDRAVKDALAGRIGAVVTGPLSKEALNLAGYPFAGHTELLAHLASSPGTCMMLTHGDFRVSHVTTHVALARVPQLITPTRLNHVIALTFDALKRFRIATPRVAVAALNPHAGEGGLFGTEDMTVIKPVVDEQRAAGRNIAGPIPGDTVFVRMLGGEFDAVIAMFHDQGHVPVKLLGFKVDKATGRWTSLSGVNTTLGLPFIRTSVDHGTAFDIAGKGIASEQSMVEAIELALKLDGDWTPR